MPTVTELLSGHEWDNVKDFDGNVQKLLLMYWEENQKMRCCGNCDVARQNKGKRTFLPCGPQPFKVCDEWRIYE